MAALKRLFELTRVPLVESQFTSYCNAFIYGLSLLWGVDAPDCDLSAACANTAFALINGPVNNNNGPTLPNAGVAMPESGGGTPDTDIAMVLPYDEEVWDMGRGAARIAVNLSL